MSGGTHKMEGGVFSVMSRRCNECLLSKAAIVGDQRRHQILEGCAADDTFFICHKATQAGDRVVACRGHFDGPTGGGQLARFARRVGLVREIDPEELA